MHARPDGRDHGLGPRELSGAWALLCEQPGLRGEVLKVETVRSPRPEAARAAGGASHAQVRARLEVAADAPLGPREIRVATPQGASSVGLSWSSIDPVVTEADDAANDRPATAQKLTLPAVVSGRIGKLEDVDWYAFEPRKASASRSRSGATASRTRSTTCKTHLDPILSLHDRRAASWPPPITPTSPTRCSRSRPGEPDLLPSGPRHDLLGQPGVVLRTSRRDGPGGDLGVSAGGQPGNDRQRSSCAGRAIDPAAIALP